MSIQGSNRSGRIKIDPNNVPKLFHSLIPYAEKWGITDDGYLDNVIDKASIEELRDLVTTISEFRAEGFDEWLRDPKMNGHTREWAAFICLIDANDMAKLRLRAENGNPIEK